MPPTEDSHADALTAVIRARRTLKPDAMDADRPVSREHLGLLLENATWAPTHGLTQPWRFTVFEGDSRQALATKLQEIYRAEVTGTAFREDKLEKLGRNPLLAPCVIALGVAPLAGGKIPVVEEIEAVSCAAQNLLLTATALGLGSFWSSPPILGTRAMADFLDLEGELDQCLGLLYLGWPREGTAVPVSVRSPWEAKVAWR